MIGIGDVRDYIADLGLTEKDHVYCGKLEAKKEKSIGIYNLKRSGSPNIPIGGIANSSYCIKPVSILIHWTESIRETEQAAEKLFYKLLRMRDFTINGEKMKFVRLLTPEPVDVGTDDNGIFEMVIEMEIYYERKGDNSE